MLMVVAVEIVKANYVISENMMSRWILTVTKQVPDNQYTHLCIKP